MGIPCEVGLKEVSRACCLMATIAYVQNIIAHIELKQKNL